MVEIQALDIHGNFFMAAPKHGSITCAEIGAEIKNGGAFKMMTDAEIDRIADAVTERMFERLTNEPGHLPISHKMSSKEIGERLGVSSTTVNARAKRMGLIELGAGPHNTKIYCGQSFARFLKSREA